MADGGPIVCQLCSWLGEGGRGHGVATWRWTFIDGTSQLVCGRHKAQAARAGGHGQPISELVGLVVAPTDRLQGVADAAKPLSVVDQVLARLQPEIRAALQDTLRGAVVSVDFEGDRRARRAS